MSTFPEELHDSIKSKKKYTVCLQTKSFWVAPWWRSNTGSNMGWKSLPDVKQSSLMNTKLKHQGYEMISNHSFKHHFSFTTTLAPRGRCSPTGRVCTGKLCRGRWSVMIGSNRLSGRVPLLCKRPYKTLASAASVSSCICGSETRSSPGSQWVSNCWPGEPSLGPTGTSGGWISSPVQALGGV